MNTTTFRFEITYVSMEIEQMAFVLALLVCAGIGFAFGHVVGFAAGADHGRKFKWSGH